jgi:hypothetical protein
MHTVSTSQQSTEETPSALIDTADRKLIGCQRMDMGQVHSPNSAHTAGGHITKVSREMTRICWPLVICLASNATITLQCLPDASCGAFYLHQSILKPGSPHQQAAVESQLHVSHTVSRRYSYTILPKLIKINVYAHGGNEASAHAALST